MCNSKTALRANRICLSYGKYSKQCLTDVSLSLYPGELVALIGPNGAGKTSVVKVLTGLLRSSSGHVYLFEQPLCQLHRREIAQRVAVVPQHVRIAFGFTVREVVLMGRAPHQGAMLIPTSTDQDLVSDILKQTGLSGLADRPVTGLSGGEQKRVGIARALAQQPEVLILDEAGAHLDIRHRVDLHALVRDAIDSRNLACLSVMHDLSEVAQHADRVVLLNQGHVRAQGTVEEVMTYEILRETFRVDLHMGVNEADGTRYFVPIRSVT
ncbi:MAG: ABC transporter permease [Sorangium cellulosum]|nr:MAG: ABC transporter permease [Sorangium cellulosum]